ncbi:hypothetical protein, partial [Achromobacter spanius]
MSFRPARAEWLARPSLARLLAQPSLARPRAQPSTARPLALPSLIRPRAALVSLAHLSSPHRRLSSRTRLSLALRVALPAVVLAA